MHRRVPIAAQLAASIAYMNFRTRYQLGVTLTIDSPKNNVEQGLMLPWGAHNYSCSAARNTGNIDKRVPEQVAMGQRELGPISNPSQPPNSTQDRVKPLLNRVNQSRGSI